MIFFLWILMDDGIGDERLFHRWKA